MSGGGGGGEKCKCGDKKKREGKKMQYTGEKIQYVNGGDDLNAQYIPLNHENILSRREPCIRCEIFYIQKGFKLNATSQNTFYSRCII